MFILLLKDCSIALMGIETSKIPRTLQVIILRLDAEESVDAAAIWKHSR